MASTRSHPPGPASVAGPRGEGGARQRGVCERAPLPVLVSVYAHSRPPVHATAAAGSLRAHGGVVVVSPSSRVALAVALWVSRGGRRPTAGARRPTRPRRASGSPRWSARPTSCAPRGVLPRAGRRGAGLDLDVRPGRQPDVLQPGRRGAARPRRPGRPGAGRPHPPRGPAGAAGGRLVGRRRAACTPTARGARWRRARSPCATARAGSPAGAASTATSRRPRRRQRAARSAWAWRSCAGPWWTAAATSWPTSWWATAACSTATRRPSCWSWAAAGRSG